MWREVRAILGTQNLPLTNAHRRVFLALLELLTPITPAVHRDNAEIIGAAGLAGN